MEKEVLDDEDNFIQKEDIHNVNIEESKLIEEEDEIIDKIKSLEAEIVDYGDKFKRNLAEFDNFRKRTTIEKASMYDNGVKDTIEKMLPILDNFERAITSTKEEDKENPIFKGIEMIYTQMLETFTNMGIEEINDVGEKFDTNLHNAVMHIEDDTFGENVVAEVLQKGYKYKDKVIRTSMVKVAN